MSNIFNGLTEAELDALATQYRWSASELLHAKATAACANSWGAECVVVTQNGRELRSPPYPEPCSYVRVVQSGFELGYWNSDEWSKEPEDVIGAVAGALSSGSDELRAEEPSLSQGQPFVQR